MPTIDANRQSWDKDWGHDGDDWSQAWGGTESMWRGSVMTRIGRFLPTRSLLEIAPGRGRLTQFLLPQCRRYVGIDLSEASVEACRARFASAPHARFERNDGASLAMVEDASVDFAFSWDSLVHVDETVLRAYVGGLARVLVPGGCAFLHHSNLGAHAGHDGRLAVENPHWRDPGVSAATARDACREYGLSCLAQEFVQWGVTHYNDCFTLLGRPERDEVRRDVPRVFEHPSMIEEMRLFRAIEECYWNAGPESS